MNEPNLQSDAARSRDSKNDLELLARALPPTANIEDHLPTTRMPSIAPPLPPVRPPPQPVVRPVERAEATVKVARVQKLEKASAARASLHDGWLALRTRASFLTLRHTIGGAYAVLGASLLVTSFIVGLFAITSGHAPGDTSGLAVAIVLARALVALGGMAIGYALLASARGVLLARLTPRKGAIVERT